MMTRAGGPGRIRRGVYRFLLLTYPPSFRRRYRGDLMDTFAEMWSADARGRPLQEVRFWLRLVRDAVTGGLRTRFTRTRAPAGPFGIEEVVGYRGIVTGVRSDVRQAVRGFRRSPAFAAVVVSTLALGIGATTAMFSVLHDVLIRPLPYAAADRLMRVYMTEVNDPGSREYVTGAHYLGYRDGMRSFESLASVYTYSEAGADLMVGGRPERIRVLRVSPEYFDVLGRPPHRGRGFVEAESRTSARVALLSARLSEQAFGGPTEAVGATLMLSGEAWEVIGVMARGFEDPLAGPVDVWVPEYLEVSDSTNQPYNHYLSVIGRLAAGVGVEAAQAELDGVSLQLAERYPEQNEWRATIVALHEDLVGSAQAMLYVLFGAVGLVLLVVCVNVANLFLVRSLGRRREFAVRSALGSSGVRLGRQLLTESLMLALAGGALGIGVAWIGVAALTVLGANTIPRLADVGFDGGVLAFAFIVSALTGVAFGIVPAVRFARRNVYDELVERSGTGNRRLGQLRGGLVVAQVALSLVLVSGAGLLVASFRQLRQVELGFNEEDALTFSLYLPAVRYDDDARARFHPELARRIESLAGVTAAGAISRLPATGRYHSWGVNPDTGPLAGRDDSAIGGEQRVVDSHAFAALGIELVRGRLFDDRDAADAPRRYVINERMAERLYPGVDPIGQVIRTGSYPGEVIGVVRNVVTTVEGEVRPVLYHHHPQFASNRNWALTHVVRTSGDPMALVASIRRTLAEMDPELVLFQPHRLENVIDDGLGQRRFALALMVAFAGVALALAALGQYAVLAFAVAQRRREFGVRMAMGATAGRIGRLVFTHGLTLALGGAVLGIGTSLFVSRWLESLVYNVRVNDPRVIAAVTLLVILVASVAGFVPAMRATRVDLRRVLEDV